MQGRRRDPHDTGRRVPVSRHTAAVSTMWAMKGRVLVVDDDAALAEMLGIVLRGEGFEPAFCADGDEALGRLPRHPGRTWSCST